MRLPAKRSFLTVPLVTTVVLLAYACATSPEHETKTTTEAAHEHSEAATVKKSPVPPTSEVKKQLAALEKKPLKASPKIEPAKPGPKREIAAHDEKGKRPTKYVTAEVLNVRARPSTGSRVVGKLTRGSMLPVTIEGEWAKLGTDQYVQTKYLSTTPTTRRVASK